MKILILVLVLLSFGCAPKSPPKPEIIYIDKVCYYDKCATSVEPVYSPLDLSSHVGSAYNVNILIDNLTLMRDYNNSLKNTVDCYERQNKK